MAIGFGADMKAGLMGVTTGIIGNVATGLGGAALVWGLDSVFGLQVGQKAKNQNQIQRLTAALGSINTEIGQLETEITAISKQITQLSEQMQKDYQATLNVVLSTDFTNAQSVIQSNWKTYRILMQSTATPGSAPATGQAETLANAILDTNVGVEPQILTMVNLLLPQPVGTPGSNNMLDNWTTTQIQNAIYHGVPLSMAYNLLEQYFLQYLQVVYQGMALMVNALVCQASQNAFKQNPNDPAGAQTAGQQAGVAYLTGTLPVTLPGAGSTKGVPLILAELSQFFVQCTHRLLLSQYMRIDPNSTTGTVFMKPPTLADAQYVISRASLAYFLINNPGKPAPSGPVNPSLGDPIISSPGIVVVSYNRPSQTSKGGGPLLTPSSSYAASAGKVFPLTYGYAQNWYKVCDYTDATYASLVDIESSAIAIVDYQWPTPVPAPAVPPQAVGTNGVFAQTFAQYYDVTTLDVVDAPTDNTVVMAFGLDWSSIYENLFFQAPQWQVGVFATGTSPFQTLMTPTSFSSDWLSRGYAFYGSCSEKPNVNGGMAFSFVIDGQYKLSSKVNPPPGFTFYLSRNLSFSGTNTAILYYCGSAAMSFDVTNNKTKTESLIPAQLRYSVGRGQPPVQWVSFYNVSDITLNPGPGQGSWDGFSNVVGNSVSDIAGINWGLSCSVNCAALHQTDGVIYGSSQHLDVNGSWTVDSRTFIAWEQPVIDN